MLQPLLNVFSPLGKIKSIIKILIYSARCGAAIQIGLHHAVVRYLVHFISIIFYQSIAIFDNKS